MSLRSYNHRCEIHVLFDFNFTENYYRNKQKQEKKCILRCAPSLSPVFPWGKNSTPHKEGVAQDLLFGRHYSESATNISSLSPLHFVSNVNYQNRSIQDPLEEKSFDPKKEQQHFFPIGLIDLSKNIF